VVLYVTYLEDVGPDLAAVGRGFLHPDNRTYLDYCGWLCGYGSGRFRWCDRLNQNSLNNPALSWM
jgi:hypothetical protein